MYVSGSIYLILSLSSKYNFFIMFSFLLQNLKLKMQYFLHKQFFNNKMNLWNISCSYIGEIALLSWFYKKNNVLLTLTLSEN